MSCAALRAAARSHSNSAPTQRAPTRLLTVSPRVRCRPHSPARTDPGTTDVVAHRTAAALSPGCVARSPDLRLWLLPVVLSQSTAPVPPASSYQTARVAADRSGIVFVSARSLASPAANARPGRRSCHVPRPFLFPTLPPKHQPTTLLPQCAALHSPLPLSLHLFAQVTATLSDRLSRSPSAATAP